MSRNDELEGYNNSFAEIVKKRFLTKFSEESFSEQFPLENVAGFMGRAVLGNMRGFIFAWDNLSDNCINGKVSYLSPHPILWCRTSPSKSIV